MGNENDRFDLGETLLTYCIKGLGGTSILIDRDDLKVPYGEDCRITSLLEMQKSFPS